MKKAAKKSVAATEGAVSFATRQELIAAFKLWVIDTRIERTCSYDTAAEMSADEVAVADVNTLLVYLDRARAG